jgi:type II secretory pathway pseudopilin PulG
MTLVELLVCVVVLASVASIVLPSLAAVSKLVQAAEGEALAYVYAQRELAVLQLKAREVSSLEDFPEKGGGLLKRDKRYRWALSAFPFTEDPALRLVQVHTTWPGRRGIEKYVVTTALRIEPVE